MTIITRPQSKEYSDNFDRIFGKKPESPNPEHSTVDNPIGNPQSWQQEKTQGTETAAIS